MHAFKQVDVFTAEGFRGNPVAVLLDANDVDSETMQRIANWTNLSETTFVLAPTDAAADYRVRIFTPDQELPFAGHPTIGTCHAWLEAGGTPKQSDRIVQECGVGLIDLKRSGERLAFAAPPLIRSGPLEAPELDLICRVIGIDADEVVDSQWVDNGPGWTAVRLKDADAVLALEPNLEAASDYKIGVVGPYPSSDDADAPAIEVRAFFRAGGQPAEDPVTGSLNASLAQWMLDADVISSPYIASQGTALGRLGRVHVTRDDEGTWIGGDAVTCFDGQALV